MRTPADLTSLPPSSLTQTPVDGTSLLGALAETSPAQRSALRDRGVQLAAVDGFAPTSGFDCRGRNAPVPGMECLQGPNLRMQDGWHWTMPRK